MRLWEDKSNSVICSVYTHNSYLINSNDSSYLGAGGRGGEV
jgi:hypothetical protein